MSKVTVYTTTYCAFCSAAKRFLDELGVEFEEVALDDRPELRQRLSAENNGFRTVPMVFADDELLGGFQEILELHSQGKLLPRVAGELRSGAPS